MKVVIVLWLAWFCGVEGVYENNPFLNGNYNTSGAEVPSKVDEMPANVVNLPTAKPEEAQENLRKYCLGPRGHFRSKYCNTFVDCWEDRAVEFICPTPLYFNTEGYCDYPQNVNCDGKGLKPGSPFQPSNGGTYLPPPSSVAPQNPPQSTFGGWPIDGSYKPPVAQNPPQNHLDDGSWKPGTGGWDDGSYKPSQGNWDDGSYKPVQGSWDDGSYKPQPPVVKPTSPPVVPPVVIQQPVPPVQVITHPPVSWTTLAPPVEVTTASPVQLPQLPANKYCKNPRGQFPGSACNKYVNCWDGYSVEQECPEGLNFNPYKGYCDYPWNYNCNHTGEFPVSVGPVVPTLPPSVGSSSVQPPVSSTPAFLPPVQLLPGNKFCKEQRGQFPGSACNKYVNCWDGIVLEQECPEGYNFNPQKGYCDFPWNYNCGKPVEVPVTSAPVPAVPPASATTQGWSHLLKYCLKPRGQFPGTSCEKYVDCWDGYVVEQECAKGLVFNPIKYYCDYGPHPNCPNTVRNHNLPTDAVDPLLSCRTGTIFSLNENCSHVAICRNDLIEIVQCPQGLKYDAAKDSCLVPHLAKC